MRYLLDTQILLWILSDDERLSNHLRKLLISEESKHYISVASLWEIGIKVSLGKLVLKGGVRQVMKQAKEMGVEVMSIEANYIKKIEELEFHHGDPFDRMIIATAMEEKMTVMSSDRHFDRYEIQLEKN